MSLKKSHLKMTFMTLEDRIKKKGWKGPLSSSPTPSQAEPLYHSGRMAVQSWESREQKAGNSQLK